MNKPVEKLGAFYLGREYDLATSTRTEELIAYDARDLTTHAVCVGMTGSGKTGLCIDLLEEAAIDGVPALIIDPKGDMTNLLLNFPELRPADFEPWVNIDDARRKDMEVPAYAQRVAEIWRDGLADWGQDGERMRLLQGAVERQVFTPGSDAGAQVSVLASLKAPDLGWDQHQEQLREQIQGLTSALLGLVGIEADPLRSREHILIANLMEHYWRQGEDLDLGKLITALQAPPLRKLGVFDVDTFFPEQDRFELAMAFNAVMASPSFGAWLQGAPLDIGALLHSPNGKPRHSIFYIAHLSDAERMFFVTLLLEALLAWTRQQSGTTSLRALLYMDEVFGFFPPVANPPSKKPLLTMMKQARAFGVGVVLATQNPVDLDYKGLSNAGTWFVGKLQTERDKERLLEGLQAASGVAGGAVDAKELAQAISALGQRVFLLHNVHEPAPVIFQTRWAMSYLRGPLTRQQLRTLPGVKGAAPSALSSTSAQANTDASAAASEQTAVAGPPQLAPDVEQVFFPQQVGASTALSDIEARVGQRCEAIEQTLVYSPALLARGSVDFIDAKREIDETRSFTLLLPPTAIGAVVRWDEAEAVELELDALEERAEEDAVFAPLSAELNDAKELKALGKSFADHLYREQRLELFHNGKLKLHGAAGETEREFQARAQQLAREGRDAEVEKLRKKVRGQLDKLERKLQREQRELTEDQAKYDARKREEMLSGAETVIGVLGIFGRRRRVTTGLSRAATKRRLTATAQAAIEESEEEITRLQEEIADVDRSLQEDAAEIAEKWQEIAAATETKQIKPRKSDVRVELVALAWLPSWEISYRAPGGDAQREWVAAWDGATRT